MLIVLPGDLRQILIAIPVLQCLLKDRPDSDFLLLAGEPFVGFLSGLFGGERILPLREEEFHWGETHYQDLLRATGAFQPGLTLNLAETANPLLHFLLRSTRAPIRVQVSGEERRPFANIFLHASEPPNHLRRFLQTLRLWDFAEKPIIPKWSRLGASPENLREAAGRLNSKGLRPETTRLFLWQGTSPQRERELFQATVKERGPQGAAQALVVINGGGPLWATPQPPQDLLLGLPSLEVMSTGLMLGLFAQTARSIGTSGPLLDLAGISDTDVIGHYEESDVAWDTSSLNPRMKVIYSKPPGAPPLPGPPGAA